MSKQRNAHVAIFLPDLGGGGAEKILSTLANEFLNRGLQVDFLLVKAVGVNLKNLSPGIHLVDFACSSTYLSLPRLVSYFRQARPDVLISSLDLTNLIALIARRIAGVETRVFIRVENMISFQRRTPFKKMLEKMLLSWIYPWADEIITVSKHVMDDLAVYTGISPSRMRVIYSPVLTPELRIKAAELISGPWLMDSKVPLILGAGRLTEQKDFEVLIRAFSVLRRKVASKLIILGDGELRPQLEALVRELQLEQDLYLPGYMENLYALMKQAKVFVLSSAWEGLPTVLIEALICDCLVVSTDCPGGVREILDGEKYGELVEVGNVQAMAAAMERALSLNDRIVDPQWLLQFSLEKIVDENLKLILDSAR